jgi:hypothetical protein
MIQMTLNAPRHPIFSLASGFLCHVEVHEVSADEKERHKVNEEQELVYAPQKEEAACGELLALGCVSVFPEWRDPRRQFHGESSIKGDKNPPLKVSNIAQSHRADLGTIRQSGPQEEREVLHGRFVKTPFPTSTKW